MKVIGAGFGRTGTTSLMAALEELGFGPCYHAERVITHPHYAKVWLAAAQNGQVDWQRHLGNYEATLDYPACRFYKELLIAFPDAKVLLSVRDAEGWYESTYETIYAASARKPRWLTRLFPPLRWIDEMIHAVVWDGIFHGQFEDREYAIARFNQHIEEVKITVPSEKLLVFDVKEDWEPLCTFLDVPVPGKPFPHLNDRPRLKRLARIVDWLNR